MAKLQWKFYYADVRRAFGWGFFLGILVTLMTLAALGVFR